MLKVTRESGKFRISIGDRKPVWANNENEVKEAVTHHYATPGHAKFRKTCPFCRKMREEGTW